MLVYLIQYLLFALFKLLFRFECFGLKNIPKDGPVLFVSNHTSNLDPFLCGVYIFFQRDLHFLAKQELFSTFIGNWFFRTLNSHPIKRGGADRHAIKTILNLLENNKAILLFPEGTRSEDGELRKGRAGVGFLLYQARVPVIPIYIENSHRALPKGNFLPRFTKVRMYVGKPQVWSDLWEQDSSKEIYQKISDRTIEEIRKLKIQSQE